MTIEVSSMEYLLPIILSTCAFTFAIMTAGFSIFAYATVVGLKNSTHKIEYMPLPTPGDPDYDEYNKSDKELEKEFNRQLQNDVDELF